MRCPCDSGRDYDECCGPAHRGERWPETPSELVRARFSAFDRGAADFLWDSLHPDHDDRKEAQEAWTDELKSHLQRRRYAKLEILDAREADADGVACVLFMATAVGRRTKKGGGRSRFAELSRFAQVDGQWRYLVGSLAPASEVKAAKRTVAAFEAAFG